MERNWVGAVVTNTQINRTKTFWDHIASEVMTPRDRLNWRLQQLLYRAAYDHLVQVRARSERAGELKATHALAQAASDPAHAISAALAALDAAERDADAASLEAWIDMRVFAEAVFQSVHEVSVSSALRHVFHRVVAPPSTAPSRHMKIHNMYSRNIHHNIQLSVTCLVLRISPGALRMLVAQQFSVPIYGGEYTRRGNNLDLAHMPLSNAPFLRKQIANLSGAGLAPAELGERLVALAAWTQPGEGSFFDDLGELDAPHFVMPPNSSVLTGDQSLRPSPSYEVVPPSSQYYQEEPHGHHSTVPPSLPVQRRSQLTSVSTHKAVEKGYPYVPILLRYPNLPGGAKYNVSVTGLKTTHNLTANGIFILRDNTAHVLERKTYPIPAHITALGGTLELAWSSSYGVELHEAWLLRTG
eukprot:COSAG01_NODE_3123_length_6553_cov_9.997676_2_plen_414_part_00